MSQNYSYTFKLINSVSIINLPYAIQNARKLKIKFLRYITASALNDTLIIKINQFNENVYYDGTRIIKCAKVLPLPSTINTSFFYDNAFPEPDIIVSERAQGFSINSLTIELLINNAYSADISPTNPVYLELAIHD
jgi:hypothetical protein